MKEVEGKELYKEMNLCMKIDSLLSLPNVTTIIIQHIHYFLINIMIELAYREGGRERGRRRREKKRGI